VAPTTTPSTPTPVPTEDAVILPTPTSTPTPTPKNESAFTVPLFEGDGSERKNLLATVALVISALLAAAVTALVVLRSKNAKTALRDRGAPTNDTRIPDNEVVAVSNDRDPFTASTLLPGLATVAQPTLNTAEQTQVLREHSTTVDPATNRLNSASRYDTPLDIETIIMKRPEPQQPRTERLDLQ
jgi:hypothetical protein